MIHYQEQAYFFQFWPPQGDTKPFDTIHMLTEAEASSHPWLSSPYFHFWRFLRESDTYKGLCIDGRLSKVDDEVYRYFGDICASDDFWQWWRTCGCELFCEPRSHSPYTVDRVNVDDMLEDSENGQRVLVALSLEGDIDRTKLEIVDLLKRLKGDTPSRTRNESAALFQVLGDPKPLALDKYYRVWRYKTDNPKMPNADIAFECGLKTKRVTDPVDRTDVGNDVGRMFSKAQSIIKHIDKGVFPVLDKKAVERIPAHLDLQRTHSELRRQEIKSGKYPNPMLAYDNMVEPICVMQGG